MRAVADQMRPLSTQACLGANHEGTFKLAVLDSEVVGDARWTGLELPKVHGTYASRTDAGRDASATPASEAPHTFHEVHLSMRALHAILGSAPLSKSTVACICTGYCVVLYVYLIGQNRGPDDAPPGVLNVRSAASLTHQFVVAGLDLDT